MRALLAPLLVLALAAPGCSDDRDRPDRSVARDDGGDALPAPGRATGSVTGMPEAGDPRTLAPSEVSPELPPDAMFDSEGNRLPLEAGAGLDPGLAGGTLPADATAVPGTGPAAGDMPPPGPAGAPAPGTASADGPGPAEAIAVVKRYYDSLNAHSYGNAFALWSDGGGASGQSPQQFADSFSQVAGMSVEIMEPGRIDAAAGSRYIEVPVAVKTTRADGSVHRYVGAYTLRRAVVDGAGDEQRNWRIASADLREVRP